MSHANGIEQLIKIDDDLESVEMKFVAEANGNTFKNSLWKH